MLVGFTIAGFRNYSGEPQWVSPLGRVNVFIGPNNAGKSNILRFLRRVVHPLLAPRSGTSGALSGVDVPNGGSAAQYHAVLLPLERLVNRPTHSAIQWQASWTQELMNHQGWGPDHLRVAIRFPHVNNSAEFPIDQLPPTGTFNHPVWRDMWVALTHYTGGGDFNQWYAAIQNALVQLALEDINPHYIRTFRQITTRLEGFQDEYTLSNGGEHIIDELAELANPDWDQQHKKVQFEKLRSFVGEVIENPNVQIEIPTNRKTINVKAGGSYLPLEALGSGIHQVFMLAASIVLRNNQTILLEEPEVHLHPGLQRKFMHFLMNSTENQLFIATHSAAIIDTAGANVFGVSQESGRAVVKPLLTSVERYASCRELGYKASDLLQTNSIIWVEGPSDRIYLLDWLKRYAPQLREGVHFSIMFYGGMLLSHLTVSDSSFQDFINLLPISRTPAILIDSDKGSSTADLRDTKKRVLQEFSDLGGYAWVTEGREIENYYPFDQREVAIKDRHAKVEKLTGGRNRFAKPLTFTRVGETKEVTADKVAVAKYLTSNFVPDTTKLELGARLNGLIDYIKAANV